MALLADTSVWSLAFRRDSSPDNHEVSTLRDALQEREAVVTTGVVLLEVLRGALPKRTKEAIAQAFDNLVFVEPSRSDYVAAADLCNECREHGVQLGTVDALIAQLCIARDLVLLTTDDDFRHASKYTSLRVWSR